MFSPWCRPGQRPTPQNPCCIFTPGGTPSGGLFPFSNSARVFQGETPGASTESGPTPTPPPGPIPACFDTLTVVPFSVTPSGVITMVSGGGAALATAVGAAAAGATLRITDSLNYSAITITSKSNLTIEADSGQTPTITATAGNQGHAVTFGAGNNGVALRGLMFVGSGNATIFNGSQRTRQGIVCSPNTTANLRNVIIEDCVFIEPDATTAAGAPGLMLAGADGSQHHNVWIHRCRFINTACSATTTELSGYGALTIGGFSAVWIQNCSVTRTEAVARAASPMRGVVIKNINTVVEDVLVKDIGTGGECQAFFVPDPTSGFGSAAGLQSLRNCVVENCRYGYVNALNGSTLDLSHCVYRATEAGITIIVFYEQGEISHPVLNVIDCVATGAGDGIAFQTVLTENHNDIYNFASTGVVLDPTDLQIDPLYQGPENGDYVAVAAPCRTGGTAGGPMGVVYPGGEKIIWCSN